MPELNIRTKDLGGVTLIALKGFLDAHTFEQLDEAIQEIFDGGCANLIADLSGVEYISSAGAGVFIGSLAQASEMDGKIVLLNPTDTVREVFDLLGLSAIFTIVDSLGDAKAEF